MWNPLSDALNIYLIEIGFVLQRTTIEPCLSVGESEVGVAVLVFGVVKFFGDVGFEARVEKIPCRVA